MNVCVSANFLCRTQSPGVTVFGDGGLWEMMRSWGWSPHEWECACAHVYLCLTLRDPVCCGPPGYWSRLPFPSPGDLPDPGIEPASPALAGGLFTTLLPWMRLGHLSKRPGSALAPSVAEDAVERQPSMSPQEALSHQTPSGPVSGALTSSLQNCEKKNVCLFKKKKKENLRKHLRQKRERTITAATCQSGVRFSIR